MIPGGSGDCFEEAALSGDGAVEVDVAAIDVQELPRPLRLFEPKTGQWRIWWASSVGTGLLDEPVVGRFEDDGIGRFECDDILDGVHVRVRYVWTVVDEDTLEWEQFFSFDGRRTWDSNWRMQSTRIASAVRTEAGVLVPASL